MGIYSQWEAVPRVAASYLEDESARESELETVATVRRCSCQRPPACTTCEAEACSRSSMTSVARDLLLSLPFGCV